MASSVRPWRLALPVLGLVLTASTTRAQVLSEEESEPSPPSTARGASSEVEPDTSPEDAASTGPATTNDAAAPAPQPTTADASGEAAPPSSRGAASTVTGADPAPRPPEPGRRDDETNVPSGSDARDAEENDGSPSEPDFGVRATAELGFLSVLSHHIQLGSDGTDIDYRNDGAQTNLFLFTRLSLEVDIWRRHHLTFLYQPLRLESEVVLRRDLRIDGLDFPEETPARFVYGFPFFRFSWDYDVLGAADELLAFGLGLQLRNADISFESLDGELLRTRNDVGPVPLLRARGRFPLVDRFYFGFEIDGFYAPISVLNGSDNEVTGAILDLSLRFGWRFIDHGDLFFNLRYLAGGAVGDSDPTPTSDGRQRNWLHFLSASLGATLDSRP